MSNSSELKAQSTSGVGSGGGARGHVPPTFPSGGGKYIFLPPPPTFFQGQAFFLGFSPPTDSESDSDVQTLCRPRARPM